MLRFAALVAAAMIVASGAAQAASHHKRHHYRGHPAVVPLQPSQQIYPSRPAWAPPDACFTDDGYGRFLPCDMGGPGRN